jgi:hypothetical protein
MKKFLLIIFSVLLTVSWETSYADSFNFPKDTVWTIANGSMEIPNDITNTSSASVTLNWKVIYQNLPASWQTNFGICDNAMCYYNAILDGGQKNSNTIPTGATGGFHAVLDVTGTNEYGTYYVTVNLSDGASTNKNMTFAFGRWPTTVSSMAKGSDGIALYPNPAYSNLNVVFDANYGIKTITLYNLIGKAVRVYKVSDNNSAKLDLESMPAGIYFIRLADAQGKVVATRKFTHQ